MRATGQSPALYVHVPFCATRCRYCHFYTVTEPAWESYVDAFARQLALTADLLPAPPPSVFVGGGTPSLFPDAERRRFFSLLAPLAGPRTEFSVECNPEDVDARLLTDLAGFGVNRLSLGIQSLADEELSGVGRRHDAAGAERAIACALESSLRLSLDLMIGLPGQSEASFARTLRRIIALRPEHLSIYCLEGIEGGSSLSGRADDEQVAASYLHAHAELAEAGYEAYEVSNWSLPGAECRHNLAIWRGGEYLGVGPAAHSLLGGRRWSWPADLGAWTQALLGGAAPDWCEDERDGAALALERLLLGLRTREGMPLSDPLLLDRRPLLDEFTALGWGRRESDRWRLLPEGWLRLDGILGRLTT